jgi:hypothetical protein
MPDYPGLQADQFASRNVTVCRLDQSRELRMVSP